jgi:two-component system nitrate/nitrite response regulator NarL
LVAVVHGERGRNRHSASGNWASSPDGLSREWHGFDEWRWDCHEGQALPFGAPSYGAAHADARSPTGSVIEIIPQPQRPPRSRARVLVIGGDLLAETLTGALEQRGLAARHTTPADHDLDQALTWCPGLALLDVRSLGSEASRAIIARLRRAGAEVCVMIDRSDRHRCQEWLDAGAAELIGHQSPFDHVFRTVNRLLDRSVDAVGAGRTSSSPRPRLAPPAPPEIDRRPDLFAILTEREQHVLAELMDGHCAEEIANASCVSISTVRSQIKAILQKLGVNSQLAAVALARRLGWARDAAVH